MRIFRHRYAAGASGLSGGNRARQCGAAVRYGANSVVNMADQLYANGLPLIIDCGVDDFLIDINREVHRRLVYNHTPHEYTERPGAHTWAYWQNALPYHVLFFQKVLEAGGVAVK